VKRDPVTGNLLMSNAQKIEELAESFGVTTEGRMHSTPMGKNFAQTVEPHKE